VLADYPTQMVVTMHAATLAMSAHTHVILPALAAKNKGTGRVKINARHTACTSNLCSLADRSLALLFKSSLPILERGHPSQCAD